MRPRGLRQGSWRGPFLTRRREEGVPGRSETWATPTDTDLQRENDGASGVQGETAASEVLTRTETLSLITEGCISKVTAQRTKMQSNLTVVKRQTTEKTSPESRAEWRPAAAGLPADRADGRAGGAKVRVGRAARAHKAQRQPLRRHAGKRTRLCCTRVHRED